MTKIGLLVGREWSFPPALVEEVARRAENLTVEYVKLGTPSLDDPNPYSVIVDRMSHEVPFYRAYLRHAARRGVRVINGPSSWAYEDRFTIAALAADAGIAVPRTVMLPHRAYAEGIIHEESLRNLDYPLDWRAVVEYVGLPCRLRGATGVAGPGYVCHSLDELLQHFNGSGQRLLLAEQIIVWDRFVRCFVIGGEVLALKFDPVERRYYVDHEHLTPELGQTVVDQSRDLARRIGYDINTFDWAIKDGVAYAVEVMNPYPEIDIYALTPFYFERVVEQVADLVVRLARGSAAAATGPGDASGGAGGGDTSSAGPKSSSAKPRRGKGAPVADPPAGDLAEELPSLAQGLPRSTL